MGQATITCTLNTTGECKGESHIRSSLSRSGRLPEEVIPELWIAQGCHEAEGLTEARVQIGREARAQLRTVTRCGRL